MCDIVCASFYSEIADVKTKYYKPSGRKALIISKLLKNYRINLKQKEKANSLHL